MVREGFRPTGSSSDIAVLVRGLGHHTMQNWGTHGARGRSMRKGIGGMSQAEGLRRTIDEDEFP